MASIIEHEAEQAREAPSRRLFSSGLVQVGEFRCPVSHPKFPDSGPTEHFCFVFPRTPVWIEHEGSKPFVADAKTVPLYNPGHPYRRRPISIDGDRTDWFSVSPGVLREMVATFDPSTADNRDHLFQFDFARSDTNTFLTQRRVFEHVRQNEVPDSLYVEESVINMLSDVLNEAYRTKVVLTSARASHRDLAENARAQLGRTFSQTQGLAQLAAACGTSVFHLCRVFKRQTGFTIHQYRNDLRLRRSLDLLDECEGDILTAAIELGYSGHSHFTKSFHQAFGMTPSRFCGFSVKARPSCATRLDSDEAIRRLAKRDRCPPSYTP